MKTRVVAGHEFPETVDACCIRTLPNGERCQRTWAEIENCDDSHVNQQGYAHISHLTSEELSQIRAEKQRRDEIRERAWNATIGIGSGV